MKPYCFLLSLKGVAGGDKGRWLRAPGPVVRSKAGKAACANLIRVFLLAILDLEFPY
jgi:hypothetical protein